MALSPNYGWSEPDNSSLVKNGAQDIRTLGDAIDTSLWNVGFGQAGKNKIINGDFGVWQRGTTGTFAGYGAYPAPDRFSFSSIGANTTVSRQTFTTGSAPVSGYESAYYCRIAPAAGVTYIDFGQNIEDVRVFAGQTVTFSLWAKATSSITLTPTLYQNFGSGGSSVVTTSGSNITLTSSWVRYTVTIANPSISGKTIGANNCLSAYFTSASGTIAGNTIDIWGVQLEYGSKATPFQTATGTIQGELAACQRYYYSHASGTQGSICNFLYFNATTVTAILTFPVQMRVAPTLSATTGTSYYAIETGLNLDYVNSLTAAKTTTTATQLYNASEAAGTVGLSGIGYTNNASASLAFSAEL